MKHEYVTSADNYFHGETIEYYKEGDKAYAKIIESGTGRKIWRSRGIITEPCPPGLWEQWQQYQIDAPWERFKSLKEFVNCLKYSKFKTIEELKEYVKE